MSHEASSTLDFIRPGDVPIVVKLDRLGRNMRDVLNLVHEFGGSGALFGMGSRNRSGRWTGAGRIKKRRRFRVRLFDLVCAVRLIAQPAAGEQHFHQEGDEGAHCEKQRQTKGDE
jgi:hypothetical protein